jgi:hypothetical protein
MHAMIRPGPAYMITPLHQKTKQQPASARVHRPVRERRMEPVSSTGQRGLARVVAVDRRTAISTLLLLTHVTHTYMTVNVRTTPPSTIKRERRGQLSLQNTLTACMRRPACTSSVYILHIGSVRRSVIYNRYCCALNAHRSLRYGAAALRPDASKNPANRPIRRRSSNPTRTYVLPSTEISQANWSVPDRSIPLFPSAPYRTYVTCAVPGLLDATCPGRATN